MKTVARLLLCSAVLALLGCDDDSPGTRGDTGTSLDTGDTELGGLDFGADPSDDPAADAAADGGEDGQPGDADEDPASGDAAIEAGEDGTDDDTAEDAVGDPPSEDLADATADTTDGRPDTDDAAGDPTSDPEPDLPPGECGDGALNAGEQCDDSNALNLDGCDHECRYEQIQVLVGFNFSINEGDSPCGTDNGLNDALSGTVENIVEAQLENAVQDGLLNLLLSLLDLDDPTGATDADLSLGVVVGAPNLDSSGPETTAALDSWYDAAAGQLDEDEPATQVEASLEAGTLAAGPVDLTLRLAGREAPLLDVEMALEIDSLAGSEPEAPPESFVPGFETFEETSGLLCGDVPAAALAEIAAPSDLLGLCIVEGDAYTPCPGTEVDGCTSMLDVIQGGCHPAPGFAAVTATDPDGDGNYGTLFEVDTLRVHMVDSYGPAH